MDIIKLNGYVPPSPTTYDVEYASVNGEESQVEDGTTYIEQVRADVPTIKVGWTNLTQEEAIAITSAVSNATTDVQFFYGEMKAATMRASARSLKLKFVDGAGNTYWDLSFTLNG